MGQTEFIKAFGDREFLTTGQCAKYLGLSRGTVQKLVDIGVLSAYTTIGKHRRIDAQCLKAMEEQIKGRLSLGGPQASTSDDSQERNALLEIAFRQPLHQAP